MGRSERSARQWKENRRKRIRDIQRRRKLFERDGCGCRLWHDQPPVPCRPARWNRAENYVLNWFRHEGPRGATRSHEGDGEKRGWGWYVSEGGGCVALFPPSAFLIAVEVIKSSLGTSECIDHSNFRQWKTLDRFGSTDIPVSLTGLPSVEQVNIPRLFSRYIRKIFVTGCARWNLWGTNDRG